MVMLLQHEESLVACLSVHRRVAALALVTWGFGPGIAGSQVLPAPDVSALFGARVTANARFKATRLRGDFNGDGVTDTAYLVTILPATPRHRLAPDVTVVSNAFGREPLGARGMKLALAIVQGGGKGKFLFTSDAGVGDRFATPIWTVSPPPIEVARRGSTAFAELQRQEKRIRNDVLVVGTEAGIETALYWKGRAWILFEPAEEP